MWRGASETTTMREVSGKGSRVLGTFILMVGGGLVLESDAWAVGAALMLVGAVMLSWGLLQIRGRAETRRLPLGTLVPPNTDL